MGKLDEADSKEMPPLDGELSFDDRKVVEEHMETVRRPGRRSGGCGSFPRWVLLPSVSDSQFWGPGIFPLRFRRLPLSNTIRTLHIRSVYKSV